MPDFIFFPGEDKQICVEKTVFSLPPTHSSYSFSDFIHPSTSHSNVSDIHLLLFPQSFVLPPLSLSLCVCVCVCVCCVCCVCVCVCLSFCLSFCLSVFLSVFLSVCLCLSKKPRCTSLSLYGSLYESAVGVGVLIHNSLKLTLICANNLPCNWGIEFDYICYPSVVTTHPLSV
jgi:hypothetical protein